MLHGTQVRYVNTVMPLKIRRKYVFLAGFSFHKSFKKQENNYCHDRKKPGYVLFLNGYKNSVLKPGGQWQQQVYTYRSTCRQSSWL